MRVAAPTLLALAALLFLAWRTARRAAPVAWPEVVAVWAATVAPLLAIEGLGYTWSAASIAGKLLAVCLAMGTPVLLAAGATRWLARYHAPTGARLAGIALAAGLLPALGMPLLWLILTCGITGDCL